MSNNLIEPINNIVLLPLELPKTGVIAGGGGREMS